MATAKGHLTRNRKNIQSTKQESNSSDSEEILEAFPAQENTNEKDIFIALAIIDQYNHVVYTDLTGKFPKTAQSGMQYILVAYHYVSNAIVIRA
eukprot:4296019-Ditylum_brightwellii.AAC.1